MMVDDKASLKKETCRILVVGARRDPVMRVVSLLHPNDSLTSSPLEFCTSGLPQHLEEHAMSEHICIEYLPCVARFGSYMDDTLNPVRYLAGLDYYEPDGNTSPSPSSLLRFFDEEPLNEDGQTRLFRGVDGVAIGAGIDGDEDAAQIQSFLETMISGSGSFPLKLQIIRPNSSFATMKEELAAYRLLSSEEKDEVTRQESMGPGKMARLARSLAMELIEAAITEKYGSSPAKEPQLQSPIEISEQVSTPPHLIDTDKVHFKCRKCRVTLFGQSDLEDPPHTQSRHSFSHRKVQHGGTAASLSCQSMFLQGTLDWMGQEGRFSCPNCGTKLGSTTWSGAQCSCGTWVVPAIQIPKSKVDGIEPLASTTHQPNTINYTLAEINVHTAEPAKSTSQL